MLILWRLKEIVMKRGANACYVVTPTQRDIVAPAKVENVIDTTAAGDSFSAGYLAKRIQGGTVKDSASAGHKVAGTIIQHRGAIISMDAMPTI